VSLICVFTWEWEMHSCLGFIASENFGLQLTFMGVDRAYGI
jgi:hypothetical protein